MDIIREEVINFMENSPTLSKLKNKKWYDVEDELINLIYKITGLKDNTYNNKKYSNVLEENIDKTKFNDFEYKIFLKVINNFYYQDLELYLQSRKGFLNDNEVENILKNADKIIERYSDNKDIDWETSLEEAIDFYKGEKL